MTSETTKPALWNMLSCAGCIHCVSTFGSLQRSDGPGSLRAVWYRTFMFPLPFVPLDCSLRRPLCTLYLARIALTGWCFTCSTACSIWVWLQKHAAPVAQGIVADVKLELLVLSRSRCCHSSHHPHRRTAAGGAEKP